MACRNLQRYDVRQIKPLSITLLGVWPALRRAYSSALTVVRFNFFAQGLTNISAWQLDNGTCAGIGESAINRGGCHFNLDQAF